MAWSLGREQALRDWTLAFQSAELQVWRCKNEACLEWKRHAVKSAVGGETGNGDVQKDDLTSTVSCCAAI
jgi:hypothetical protein